MKRAVIALLIIAGAGAGAWFYFVRRAAPEVGALTSPIEAALLAAGAMTGLAISIVFENDVWGERSRRLRAWLWVLALFWFNVEVWGRVFYTIATWR